MVCTKFGNIQNRVPEFLFFCPWARSEQQDKWLNGFTRDFITFFFLDIFKINIWHVMILPGDELHLK